MVAYDTARFGPDSVAFAQGWYAEHGDLRGLAADLQKVTEVTTDEVKKVVSKGALNIKNDWRDRWTGHSHIPDLPRAISYDDPKVDGQTVSTEIGPDKERRQGPLGNIIEYGSVNNAPIPGGAPAADAEEPRFAKALEDLGGDLLEGKVTK